MTGKEDAYFARAESKRLQAVNDELLAALKGFMDIWGSRDATSATKKAQQRRADLWEMANKAVAKAEGK